MSKHYWEVVGDGSTVEIWSRPWVPWFTSGVPRAFFDPNQRNPIRYPLDYSIVQQLFSPGTWEWNLDLIQRLFDRLSYEAIRRIRPLPDPLQDRVIWKANRSGRFDVKSAFRAVVGDREGEPDPSGGKFGVLISTMGSSSSYGDWKLIYSQPGLEYAQSYLSHLLNVSSVVGLMKRLAVFLGVAILLTWFGFRVDGVCALRRFYVTRE